jgi:hypothetical protein
MSYLDTPRLHFTGHFQADVSTINNVVGYFDIDSFDPAKDQKLNGNGGWNPEGTAIFRFISCTITGGQHDDRQIMSAADDPVIGMALENANDKVFGKLVDLDPQQQMVSQIWGMKLRLAGNGQPALFGGEFVPIAFYDLWGRQVFARLRSDQTLGAVYQSVLKDVVWEGESGSPLLAALKRVSQDRMLSIDFNVYGYGRDATNPRYTIGRIAGTIGPYYAGEPRHFVMGRQIAPLGEEPNPPAPVSYVDWFTCKVHDDRKIVSADFGNCLPIVDAGGELFPQGPLVLAVFKSETDVPLTQTVTADQVAILGNVDYLRPGWYAQTAGIQDFDYSGDPWCVANIGSRPILMLSPQTGGYSVLGQESLGGYYVRADNFVFRLNPEQHGQLELYASRYGQPLAGPIQVGPTLGMIGQTGSQGQPPGVPVPKVAIPPDGISYPDQAMANAAGKAVLDIKAATLKPAKPRGYIDGQLYGIGYQLPQQPQQTIGTPFNFTSVLVFSPINSPEQPTWYSDIQPILTQYGNLYPIMSRHLVDLGNYESVVAHLKILRLAFSLPIDDPNHMPVTRDLSEAKRTMILRWIDRPGSDGLPIKGTPMVSAGTASPLETIAPITLDLDPAQTRGKTAALMEFKARQTKDNP